MTTTAVTVGGFAAAHLASVLDRVCRTAGLDPEGAVLLRGHTNAVYHLPGEHVVVKIARRGTPADSVHRTVALVTWLTAQGFPTVGLHPGHQPVQTDGHLATIWTHLPQPGHPVAAAQLAAPLKALHQLTDPPLKLPSVDTVAAIRRSLAAASSLTGNERDHLARRVDRLEADLDAVTYLLPPSVIQGDPQHRNALHTGDGQAVLCDWDTAAFGQPEWDLVTVEIHCRRFGHGRAHYQDFARRYGLDITTWDGYPVLAAMRELRMITTNAKRGGTDTLAEVRRRIDQLADNDTRHRWNIL
ncbi:aminoglycoside phosphotransferase family protein [Streptomyces sp. BE20]|uniref:phosphotransferase family protein n=1 Tax=Streptomyces sp. BE20 TaxID=3002525 RepID=UPI002E781E27|nr:aminoglycoside phosphotransferase family protein [Streptomyces sp. BE20]MEE1820976.1 aminoglycoside phosphotransferase family protein [Streptomyces sp. BE20]